MITPFKPIFAAADDVLQGIPIALAGMLIVFSALIFISLFIAALPIILDVVSQYFPETEEHHESVAHPESLRPDDDAVIAAIGFVLHTELQKQSGSK